MRKNQTVYKGRNFRLEVGEVKLPNGHIAKIEVIHHPGSVVVIPRVGGVRYLLIHQYRPCLEETIWEFPAGTREPNEPLENCAYRELVEETGYRAGQLKKVLEFYPTPGMTTEFMHLFLAWDLEKAQNKLEADEILVPQIFTLSEMEKMIQQKKIVDAKTILGVWYLLLNRGQKTGDR